MSPSIWFDQWERNPKWQRLYLLTNNKKKQPQPIFFINKVNDIRYDRNQGRCAKKKTEFERKNVNRKMKGRRHYFA